MVYTPITMLSAFKHVPVTSQSAPYDWLTEEEKTMVWFTDGSVHYAATVQKWTATALHLSGTTPKD